MAEKKENVAYIEGTELKECDMTDEQKYFTRQIQDLRRKKTDLQLELDQILACLSVFENSLVQSTRTQADEILETETKIVGEK